MPGAMPMPPQAVQQLGYASPMTGVAGVAWRQGNQLVAPREVDLGDACVKCGAPAQGFRWRKTMYWISPVWILMIFVPFGLLILLILYLVLRKTAKVAAGLCPAHRKRRTTGVTVTTLLGIRGVGAFIGGLMIASESRGSDPPVGAFVVLAGVAMLITAAVTGTITVRGLA